MSRPRGGRHRDPAESRRRMLLAILLAFGLSTAATSLWAVGSPLDGTAVSTQDRIAVEDGAQSATADTSPGLQIEDSAVQPQEAEEPSESASPTEAEPTTEAETEDGDEPEPDRTIETAVFGLVNDERADAGCGPLESNALLDVAARLHAEDMAVNDFFDHLSLDGRSPTDRAAEQGYRGGVGENIAAGYPDAASVMDAWMNSEGHRANILNCDYSVIGVGTAERGGTIYWVQNFG